MLLTCILRGTPGAWTLDCLLYFLQERQWGCRLQRRWWTGNWKRVIGVEGEAAELLSQVVAWDQRVC